MQKPLRKEFATREGYGSIQKRWSELKKAVLESGTETPTRQTQEAKQVDVRQDH